jgi:hypothetical protein
MQKRAASRHLFGQVLRETTEDFTLLWLHGPFDRTILPLDSDIVLEWAVNIASQSDNYRLHALADSHDRPILTEHILLEDRVFQDTLYHLVVAALLIVRINQIYRSTCQPNAIQLRQQIIEILRSNIKRNDDWDTAAPAHEVVVWLKHVTTAIECVFPSITSISSVLPRWH